MVTWKEIGEIEFHFNWTKRFLIVLAIILGISLNADMDIYNANVMSFIDMHPDVKNIDNMTVLNDYFIISAPEIIQTRDRLRWDFWIFSAVALLGLPIPKLKSLNKIYKSSGK